MLILNNIITPLNNLHMGIKSNDRVYKMVSKISIKKGLTRNLKNKNRIHQKTKKMRVKRRRAGKPKSRHFLGGNCGCGSKPNFFSGGSPFGPSSFENVPINAFYPFNPHNVSTDPQAPVNVVDERLAPSPMNNPLSTQIAGKKSKKSKKSRKQKGGNLMTAFNSFNMNNAFPNTTASLIGTSNIGPVTQLYNNNHVSSLNHGLPDINDFHNNYNPVV